MFASVDDAMAGDGATWKRLRDYQLVGSVAEMGVAVSDTQEVARLDQLPGLDLVLVPLEQDRRFLAQAISDQLGDIAARGVTMLAGVGAASPELVLEMLAVDWVDAVVVDPSVTAELDAVLDAAARR